MGCCADHTTAQVDLWLVWVRAAVTRQLLTCVSVRLVWMQTSSFSASVGYGLSMFSMHHSLRNALASAGLGCQGTGTG
jgi:hypothetical protein